MQHYDAKKLQFLIPLKTAGGKNLEIVTSITELGEGASDAARDDVVAIHTQTGASMTAKSPFYSAHRRHQGVASPTLSFGSGVPQKNDKPTSPTIKEM